MPNVKLVFISDLEKQASQSISATVEVKGKGEIGFTSLCRESFRQAPHVYLHQIGQNWFRTRELMEGGECYGWAIDVGTDSPVPAFRRFGITNVSAAVAHYDDLLAVIARWPGTTNEWPSGWPPKKSEWSRVSDEEIHFTDPLHGDCFVSVKRLSVSAHH